VDDAEADGLVGQPERRTQWSGRAAFDPAAAACEPRAYQREAASLLARELVRGTPGLVHVATGGGKTRIANDYLASEAPGRGWRLWVTKDWSLLEQAAVDLARRHRGWAARLRRWGGTGTILHPLAEWDGREQGVVVYTTLASLAKQRRLDVAAKPDLVVWDECHWGADGAAARRLRRWGAEGRVRLLGLTATPRPPARSGFRRLFERDFATLVAEGHLARPIVEEVETGVKWAPRRRFTGGDVTAASLRALGAHAGRNRRIVGRYLEHADRYGKTLVFACDVEHAEALALRFRAAGVPTELVHSGRLEAENRAAVASFAKTAGGAQVLVNVAMLATGFDVPHVRSVFLARPTLSDVLFAQMVGRGARPHAPTGKESFHLVEFADTVERFRELLQRPPESYGCRSSASRAPSARAVREVPARRDTFTFDPDGRPLSFDVSEQTPRPLRGLWTRSGQTFGLEFELTRPGFCAATSTADWLAVAEPLREALARALPGRVGEKCLPDYVGFEGKDHRVWNVERDNSCGWEVTTRVLEGEAGMREVVEGLAALSRAADDLGLRVNHATGAHVHLAWKGKDIGDVRRALELVRLFEPALATLVPPSRLARFDPTGGRYDLAAPNGFCQPLSTVFTARRIAALRSEREVLALSEPHRRRFVTLNLRPLGELGTMEVRLHGGTLEAGKILLWLSLWQQLFWAAENRAGAGPVPVVRDTGRIVPDGDLLALASAWLPWSSQLFRQRLHQRRLEVRQLWRHPDLAPWLAFADRWEPRHFAGFPQTGG
jgi:superfamily II DNA or RNA helicase